MNLNGGFHKVNIINIYYTYMIHNEEQRCLYIVVDEIKRKILKCMNCVWEKQEASVKMVHYVRVSEKVKRSFGRPTCGPHRVDSVKEIEMCLKTHQDADWHDGLTEERGMDTKIVFGFLVKKAVKKNNNNNKKTTR